MDGTIPASTQVGEPDTKHRSVAWLHRIPSGSPCLGFTAARIRRCCADLRGRRRGRGHRRAAPVSQARGASSSRSSAAAAISMLGRHVPFDQSVEPVVVRTHPADHIPCPIRPEVGGQVAVATRQAAPRRRPCPRLLPPSRRLSWTEDRADRTRRTTRRRGPLRLRLMPSGRRRPGVGRRRRCRRRRHADDDEDGYTGRARESSAALGFDVVTVAPGCWRAWTRQAPHLSPGGPTPAHATRWPRVIWPISAPTTP